MKTKRSRQSAGRRQLYNRWLGKVKAGAEPASGGPNPPERSRLPLVLPYHRYFGISAQACGA